MKRFCSVLAVVLVLMFCLVGCSRKNQTETEPPIVSSKPNPTPSHSVSPTPSHSVAPSPSLMPGDRLPGNDANEGGGAGGTNEHGDEDGILDDIGDVAGDLIDGAGDALNDVGDAVRNGKRSLGGTSAGK